MTAKKYPYKFLDPYTRADKELFKGRNEEIEALYQMTFEADLILVYGASGTGKTSLIQCGLANKFQSYDWLELYVRRGKGINQSLNKVLCEHSGGEFEVQPLKDQQISELREKIDSVYLNAFRPIYLIFDQFEELYILGTKEEQTAFIATIKTILDIDQPVKMIFSIREEYLGYVSEFERAIPQLLQKKLRIEPMNFTKVQAVIKGTTELKSSNITLAAGELPTFTQAIFEFLQGNTTAKPTKRLTIELPYLQVLLDKLYLDLTNDESRQTPAVFSQAALNNLGAIDDVLRDFLEQQVVVISQVLRPTFPTINADATWKILSPLVTLEGTKVPISKEALQTRVKNTTTENPESLTTVFVTTLTNHKIIRSLEEEGTYEVAHDALAAKIAEKRTDEEIALLEVRRLIKSQMVINKSEQVLFTEKQLRFIAPYFGKMELGKAEKRLIADSQKAIAAKKKAQRRLRNSVIAIVVIVFMAMAGLMYWAVQERNTAQANLDFANKQKKQAQENLKIADTNLFRAAVISQHSDKEPLFEKHHLAGLEYIKTENNANNTVILYSGTKNKYDYKCC